MRINQLVANVDAMQAMAYRERSGQANSTATNPTKTTPGIDRAVRANQARYDETSKGFVQASRTRDAVSTVYGGVGKALEAVKRLQSDGLSPGQRTQAAKDYQVALDQVDAGAKAQTTTATDVTLKNKVFDPNRVASQSADQLGTKVSSRFTSVQALKGLNVSTASADDLAAAATVLSAAKQQTANQVTVIQAQTDRQANRVSEARSTLATLGVTVTNAQSDKTNNNQQLIKQIQALMQGAAILPGGLFNNQA